MVQCHQDVISFQKWVIFESRTGWKPLVVGISRREMGWEWPTLSHHFVNIWILAADIVGQPFLGSLKLLAVAVRGASLGTKLCGAELGSGAAGGSLSWEVSECLISCCYRLLQVCIIASI